jgi:ubiquitin
MANNNNDLKNAFAQKFNEFQLNGLQSYGKYLKQQQKLAKTHDNWESYGKYIENEIKRNDKKIAALNEKMA